MPAELHELRTYLSAKLLWNPDTDVERHIREFCNAYYGEAGEDIIKFINLFEKYARGWNAAMCSEGHLDCYGGGFSTQNGTSVSALNIRKLDKLAKQIKAHELTDEQARRVYGFELSWRFFKCVVCKGEFNWFSPYANPMEASEQLYNDFGEYGVKYLMESGRVPVGEEYSPNFSTRPIYWFSDMSERAPDFQIQAKLFPVINIIIRRLFFR